MSILTNAVGNVISQALKKCTGVLPIPTPCFELLHYPSCVQSMCFIYVLTWIFMAKQNKQTEKPLRYIWTQVRSNKMQTLNIKKITLGLPWWRSGWESACQCRGHGFEPWSGKIPHAMEQLGPWATTTEPARLEPVLRNKRGRDSERPRAPRQRVAPACRNWRKPSHRNEDPTQP